MNSQAMLAQIAQLPATDARKCELARAVYWINDLAECMRSRAARERCAQRGESWRRLVFDRGFAAQYCDPGARDVLTARIAGYFGIPEFMPMIAGPGREYLAHEYYYSILASGDTQSRALADEIADCPRVAPSISRALAASGTCSAIRACAMFGDLIEPVYESRAWIEEIIGDGARDGAPHHIRRLRTRIMRDMTMIDGQPLHATTYICASRALLDFIPEHLRTARAFILARIATLADWDNPLLESIRARDSRACGVISASNARYFDSALLDVLLRNTDLAFVARMLREMRIIGANPASGYRVLFDEGLAHTHAVFAMYRGELGREFTPGQMETIADDMKWSLCPFCEEDFRALV